jgi:hypothetical protein
LSNNNILFKLFRNANKVRLIVKRVVHRSISQIKVLFDETVGLDDLLDFGLTFGLFFCCGQFKLMGLKQLCRNDS